MEIIEPVEKRELRVIVRDETTNKSKSFVVQDSGMDYLLLLSNIKGKLETPEVM